MGWDMAASIKYLEDNTKPPPPYGNGRCAKWIRLALEAGGLAIDQNLGPEDGGANKGYAKDYGPRLRKAGFVSQGFLKDVAKIEQGDIALIDGYKENKEQKIKENLAGHLAMWTGAEWISDFKQPDATHPYPGSQYRLATPSVWIYRYQEASGEAK